MRLGVIDFSEKHANIGTVVWATVHILDLAWEVDHTIAMDLVQKAGTLEDDHTMKQVIYL